MKLALGTVQFGLNYGVANPHGQTSQDEARSILGHARSNGMDMLDTAIAYGESEERLGEFGIQDWQVVSKSPVVPEACSDIPGWVEDAFRNSLRRLKIKSLYRLLLHRPQQLLEQGGDRLYRAMEQLKRDGFVRKIGISIYDPVEIDVLCSRYQFDIVQAPFLISWIGA